MIWDKSIKLSLKTIKSCHWRDRAPSLTTLFKMKTQTESKFKWRCPWLQGVHFSMQVLTLHSLSVHLTRECKLQDRDVTCLVCPWIYTACTVYGKYLVLIRNCWMSEELASINVGLYYHHHLLRVNKELVVARQSPLLPSGDDSSWDLRSTEHCPPCLLQL